MICSSVKAFIFLLAFAAFRTVAAEDLWRPVFDPLLGVKIAKGGPFLDPGLAVLFRLKHVLGQEGEEETLAKTLRHSWIHKISLSLTWEDLEPQPGSFDEELLRRILSRIDKVSAEVGRKKPPMVFLKILPNTPRWSYASTPPNEIEAGTNSMGMKVLRLPGRKDATGASLPASEFPISTDPVYHQQLLRILKFLDRALMENDASAEKIPLIQYLGPSMGNFQMRLPISDPDGRYFPNKGPDRLGLGWNKEKHLEAWGAFAKSMSELPSFSRRLWVFNFTYLPATRGNGFFLTAEEQNRAAAGLLRHHPLGPDAVIYKTESLCVNFDQTILPDGTIGTKTTNALASSWRSKFLRDEVYSPYRLIAGRSLRHGWEIWAGFSPKRDTRSASNYPVEELIENSLYLDLEKKPLTILQGTLWVDLWPQESAEPESIGRLDGSSEKLEALLSGWDESIREGLRLSLTR